MSRMNIYFCGSIRGGRKDQSLYFELIQHLQKFGNVLTEHVGSQNLTSSGEGIKEKLTDKEIHDRDMAWLKKSDVIVAEVTTPSLGVGYEIGRAIDLKKKILCLYRTSPSNRLSAMIQGAESDSLDVCTYENVEDGRSIITTFLEALKQ